MRAGFSRLFLRALNRRPQNRRTSKDNKTTDKYRATDPENRATVTEPFRTTDKPANKYDRHTYQNSEDAGGRYASRNIPAGPACNQENNDVDSSYDSTLNKKSHWEPSPKDLSPT